VGTPNGTDFHQAELRPNQVAELIRFLSETLATDVVGV
jgi:hypothetical protein